MNQNMQKEIQNNFSDWRNRLTELEEPPTEGAWEKLYSRLEIKPRKREAVWWYLAAACVVFVFIFLAFFRNDKNQINEVAKAQEKSDFKMILNQPATIVKEKNVPKKRMIFLKKKIDLPLKKEQDISIQVQPAATINPEKNLSLMTTEIPK